MPLQSRGCRVVEGAARWRIRERVGLASLQQNGESRTGRSTEMHSHRRTLAVDGTAAPYPQAIGVSSVRGLVNGPLSLASSFGLVREARVAFSCGGWNQNVALGV